MVSGLDAWINGVGDEGWELASSVPLIAPNKDGRRLRDDRRAPHLQAPCSDALPEQ